MWSLFVYPVCMFFLFSLCLPQELQQHTLTQSKATLLKADTSIAGSGLCNCLTLVPDGVLRGVDLRPLMLLNPGQGCGSSPLGSLTGSMAIILGTGAALHHHGVITTVI